MAKNRAMLCQFLAFGLVLSVLIFAPKNLAEAQQLNDVLITEIMSDPSPSVGLPEAEYIELYNRTGQSISVKNWKLLMGSRSVVLPDSVLLPHSYTLLCHKNSLVALSGFGSVIGLSSFALTNDGMLLALYNNKNQLIYSISFLDTWWRLEKRSGGYALEMVDVNSPCLEKENWEVSKDSRGGTPGLRNSDEGQRPDRKIPSVQRVEIPSSSSLMVVFDKRLDSLGSVNGAGISVTGRSVAKKSVIGPAFHNLLLTLNAPLLTGERYQLQLHNIPDCAGNILRDATISVGLPVNADSEDVVINEILFNPRGDGGDFVEIYNRSVKFISLKGWSLGNLTKGMPDVIRSITSGDLIIPPNGFLALTTDAYQVEAAYPSGENRGFLEMVLMPAFSNEEGGVVLFDQNKKTLDRFEYSASMHHPFLSDVEGVSLERVDPAKPSWLTGNWHSGASMVGYATPGYANSQLLPAKSDDDFIVKPEAFTPDQDGIDDFAEISYAQSLTGKIATVRVFDVNGHLIKNILRNQLIGTAGKISWNGSDESNNVVRTGYYLILIDTFDIYGNKTQFKKKVVVVSR